MKTINLDNNGFLSAKIVKDSIDEVIHMGTNATRALFKSYTSGDKVDIRPIQLYCGTLQDFLLSWDKFATDLASKMKTTLKVDLNGVKGIHYAAIKPYLYASYDYLSVLPVTEGIFKGIKENKIDNVKKLDDFVNHSVSKAFDGKSANVGSIIEDIIDFNKENLLPLDSTETAKFNAVKEQRLFDSSDVDKMMKAFTKVLTYVSDVVKEGNTLPANDVGFSAAILAAIINYINYTVASFEKKIVLIYMYAWPFLYSNKNEKLESISVLESVLINPNLDKDVESVIGKEIDEYLCRDMDKYIELFQKYQEFLRSIGAETDSNLNDIIVKAKFDKDTMAPYYQMFDGSKEVDNIFVKDLTGSPIVEFFANAPQWIGTRRSSTILESLKDLVYIKKVASPTTTSSYNDFLFILRNDKLDDNTLAANRKTASDLISIITAIDVFILELIRKREDGIWDGFSSSHSELNAFAELRKLYLDIYREINVIALYRLKDIELRNNEIQNKLKQDVLDELTIKVPGEKPDISPDDNMMCALQDTKHISAELPQMYATPTMESLQLYDEYIQSVLMENGGYFAEAFDVAKVINSILAAVTSMFDRFTTALKDKRVKDAVAWVRQNSAMLKSAKYAGTMKVAPYKENIKLGYTRNLVNNINTLDIDSVHYPEGRQAFIDKLYGNKTISNLFESNKDKAVKKSQFENYLILGINPPADNTTTVTPISLTDDSIRTQGIPVWISNVESAEAVVNEMDAFSKTIKDALNGLKTKVLAAQPKTESAIFEADPNDNKKEETPGDASANAEEVEKQEDNADQKAAEANAEKNANDAKEDNKAMKDSYTQILADLDKVIANIVMPIGSSIRDCIVQQYNYIKDAYNLIQK